MRDEWKDSVSNYFRHIDMRHDIWYQVTVQFFLELET